MNLTRNKSRRETEFLNKVNFRLGLPVAVVVILLCFSGCRPVLKMANSLKSSAKNSGKVGDDAARAFPNNSVKATPRSAKAVTAAARTSASLQSASQSIGIASVSTRRCGERLGQLSQSYDLFPSASQTIIRVLILQLRENQRRLATARKELQDLSPDDANADRIKSECDEIEESNRRIDSKINQLYAELG